MGATSVWSQMCAATRSKNPNWFSTLCHKFAQSAAVMEGSRESQLQLCSQLITVYNYNIDASGVHG